MTIAALILLHLEDVRQTRLETVELIAPLSQADLDFVPAARRWSTGEIVDHIILATDAYNGVLDDLIRLKRNGRQPFVRLTFADFDVFYSFVPKSLLPSIEKPASLFSRFVPHRMKNFFMKNRLVRASAPGSLIPRHGLPASELRNRLLASLEVVNSAFQDNCDLDFQEMLAEHPLYGRVRMTDLPELMASHELRHQKQIMDVLSESRRRP